tara:strand:+ start:538 stop:1065 length:528 start_codon:yes stop_codon:yes gene_type:complete
MEKYKNIKGKLKIKPIDLKSMDVKSITPPSKEVNSTSDGDSTIILTRQAFDKVKFNQTVDTTFTQLGVNEEDLSFFNSNLATVGDFFSIYNNLFFLIPKEGPNSHTSLIEQSSQYVDYKANLAEIQALLDEIAELREQNLQLTLDIGNVLGAKDQIDKALRQTEKVVPRKEFKEK